MRTADSRTIPFPAAQAGGAVGAGGADVSQTFG